MKGSSGWLGTLSIEFESRDEADRLARALAPELAREVPRATARMSRSNPAEVALEITARETGAFRAALNTYLGWIQLVLSTAQIARESEAAS